jgi:hypothetical protein
MAGVGESSIEMVETTWLTKTGWWCNNHLEK